MKTQFNPKKSNFKEEKMSIKVKKSKNWIFLLAMISLLGVFGIAHNADATGTFRDRYDTAHGTSGTSCSFCHTSAPDLNATGQILLASANPPGSTNFDYCSIGPDTGTCAPQAVLTTISVTPPSASITQGSTQQFSAQARDQNGNPMSPQPTFTWTSSNTAVASVNSSGLATGVAAGGPVTITAASGTISGTASLTVTASAPVLTSITIDPTTASIAVGATRQFTATARDQNSNPMSPQPTFTWTSSNTAVASVNSSGLATGVAAGGPVTITAASGTIKGTASITISTPTPGTPDMTIWVGQWLKITSRYNGYLSQSSKLNAKRASVVGYIKFRSWNPDQNVLQADLYQYDSEISEWVSDALPIQYLAGSKLDFLGLSQVTGNFTSGFTARIQGKEKGGVLERATFKTMGGFYVEAIGESESGSESGSEASEHNAGGLSMNGTLIPESNVPEAILH